jgi:uncharacterized RDD family membrane protein YckC
LNGEFTLVSTDGALATQMRPMVRPLPAVKAPKPPNLARAVQTSLFEERVSKVVPIAPPQPRAPKPGAVKTAPRRARRPVPEGQGTLDFLPAQPPQPRTLGTAAEAVIRCDESPATPLHRAVAAAIDWSMVLIAYGLFLLAFRIFGGQFALNKINLMVFGGALVLIALSYGLIWTISGTETAGMYWTYLRLVSFEGFPPDSRHRLMRFLGSCLSVSTVLGLLWSLVDEESLTWQDHISRTFPTPRHLETQVFRRG